LGRCNLWVKSPDLLNAAWLGITLL